MFWKIYFWVFTIVVTVGYFIDTFMGIWDIVGILAVAVALIGLFSYAHQKIFLTGAFWKVYVPIYIVWDIVYALFTADAAASKEISGESIFELHFLLHVPLYTALIFYAGRLINHERKEFYKDEKNLTRDLQNINRTSGTADHSAPARIFISRKSMRLRSGVHQYIKLDGELISELKNGQYTTIEVVEGRHSIGFSEVKHAWRGEKIKDIEEFNLKFEGGRTYYYLIRNETLFPTLEQINTPYHRQLVDTLEHVPVNKAIS